MKNYIFVLLFMFSVAIIKAQVRDTLANNINNSFLIYAKSQNLEDLYSISFKLPWGIHYQNEGITNEDLIESRRTRTKLYVEWLSKMIQAGLDISYNPNDPKNKFYGNSISIIDASGDPEQKRKIEDWNKQNNEKLEKLIQFDRYTRAMDRFRCFYKVGYVRYGLKKETVEKYIREYASDTKMNSSDVEKLVSIFNSELKKSTCDIF